MIRVLHVWPSKGGIGDYGRKIDEIYRRQKGFAIDVLEVQGEESASQLTAAVLARRPSLVHLEIGAGDSLIFRLARELIKDSATPLLLTIHDPGAVVWHPIHLKWATYGPAPLKVVAKVIRKLLNILSGQLIVQRLLSSERVRIIYLRPDLVDGERSFYLPQPTYHEKQPPIKDPPPAARIGFAGFWGPGKGLETLLTAWPLVKPAAQLVISGGTADPADSYAQKIRALASASKAELPGFVNDDQLDAFLGSLSAVVLPYWPELPSGSSAMAMRVAELGVPIIASTTPALQVQLGPDGAIYVPPKNPVSLATAIGEVIQNRPPAAARAAATQKSTFSKHSWKVVGAKLSEITRAAGSAK